MKLKLQKIISILLIVQLLMLSPFSVVSAQEVPSDPTPTSNVAEVQSTATTESPAPSPSSDTSDTTPPPSDTTTATDTQSITTDANPASNSTETSNDQQTQIDPTTDRDAYKAEQDRLARLAWEQANPELAALAHQSGVGDTEVVTGASSSNGALVSTGNNNLASGEDGGSTSVLNSDNGAFSDNNSSATIVNDTNTNQDNSARVMSGLDGDSTTGDNSASFNVGDSALDTGDANTTGTIINALNTNVDGVMVSEFNIVDDHVGDIVLDFAANCISGCGLLGGISAVNSGNGAFSDNDANAQLTNNNNTSQNNNGTLDNDLVLSADSGNNAADFNTGGDSSITTGDANVAANALTFLNNNIAGNVIYSVVNIFGDLVGDIIFPESQLNCCGSPNISAGNSGNGVSSDNTANASLSNNDATFQTNDATINNNLVFDAQTGDNSTSYNTGGSSTVTTGDASVDANVLNILNNNITGGNMWLVLINQAGNWIGKLMGSVGGASYAGSEGLEFNIGNLGNGAGSTNTADASVTNNNTTTQNNNATVNNTLNLSANTGGNSSSFNTGGDSTIQTGDANIIANLVNFVNNNISGGGKLFVTVVNVFGSWTGDFFGPNSQKDKSEIRNQKSEINSNVQNANLLNDSSNASNSSNNNDTTTGSGIVKGITNVMSNFSFTNPNPSHSSTTSNPSANPGGGLLVSADIKVAGAKDTVNQKEKKIKINLAWLLVILPVLLLVVVLRRLVMRRVS